MADTAPGGGGGEPASRGQGLDEGDSSDAAAPSQAVDDVLPAGVRAVEHTADVAIEIAAGSLPELFARAAAGMTALLYGRAPAVSSQTTREVEVAAPDAAALLREWLRELLYLQEVEGFVFARVEVDALEEGRLAARVGGGAVAATPEREIKGVTLHDLVVERADSGWRARVIFDV